MFHTPRIPLKLVEHRTLVLTVFAAVPCCAAPAALSAGLHQLPLNGTQQLEVRGLKLHVYSKADAVADSLKIHQGWEAHVVNQLTWAIQQYKLQFVHYEGVLGRGGLQAAAASYKAPLVVDVGANMGWIMMSAAAQGARVIAFEGGGFLH